MININNSVRLIGNVGADPEIKTLESGVKIASFSLATTDVYKDKSGEKKKDTEWHRIVAFGGVAGVIEGYVKKGKQIAVEGKLKTRSWEKDGKTNYITEVVINSMQLLGGKTDGPADESDDLPF